jgi:hypothetical protein
MTKTIPVLLLTVFCGCGAGYDFSPYVGQQQNWQIQSGSYVRVVDKATLYSPGQFPDRPYFILGSVTTDSEGNVAKAVHAQHADAALISTDHIYRTGTVAVARAGVFWGIPLTHTDVSAQLIKFR